MLALALHTLRFRKGGFLGTFVALFFGSALVLASASLTETGVRTTPLPQRPDTGLRHQSGGVMLGLTLRPLRHRDQHQAPVDKMAHSRTRVVAPCLA
ncbi:hypothetical protein SAMN04487818_111177 [Actinokineospora terrae]|uniref:Uncharacterized protein n=1 Tax=Actinokineospora terrae TaxID=155974 RepID=A0A1H9WST5_9PSEU|nr:hypothetical protein SAMN04487818_111177 [Actinokineospora terrae]